MKKKEVHSHEKFDGLILTRNLAAREQENAKNELSEARRRVQSGLSDKDRLAASVLQFKLKLNDYLKKDDFDRDMSFSSCLRQYVQILAMKRKAFAKDIDIEEAELSQVINQHRPPAEYLFV